MKRGYLFISNSTKPHSEIYESLESIGPNSFSRAAIWAANEMGWELHMGINRKYPEKIKSKDYDIKFYNQHTFRNIFALRDNWKGYKNLCNYLKRNPHIQIIHCNTPIGGVIGRLAGKKYKKKVIYTAHGFHFYKGAPFFNRTVLKYIEKWLAKYTDLLITINKEDFEVAKPFKLRKGGKIIYIPGVGIDLTPFTDVKKNNKSNIRKELGLTYKDIIVISMGDLVTRKNYDHALRIIAKAHNKKIQYLICGDGNNKDKLINLARRLNIEEQIHFLGYRTDIQELLNISDIFMLTSMQEGLPRSVMEAMKAGLPCIVSDIRGNRDLIENEKGGYLCPLDNVSRWIHALNKLTSDKRLRQRMGNENRKQIERFDLNIIQKELLDVFLHVIN